MLAIVLSDESFKLIGRQWFRVIKTLGVFTIVRRKKYFM